MEILQAVVLMIADAVVNHIGEPVAVLIPESQSVAEDAVQLNVNYDHLPPIVSVEQSLAGLELVHSGSFSNVLVVGQELSTVST